MQVVKEYVKDRTKIRIHDDYITKESKETKELIVNLVIDYLKNKNN